MFLLWSERDNFRPPKTHFSAQAINNVLHTKKQGEKKKNLRNEL